MSPNIVLNGSRKLLSTRLPVIVAAGISFAISCLRIC
jgi:hypothetical protein